MRIGQRIAGSQRLGAHHSQWSLAGDIKLPHFSVSHPCFKELKEWLYPNGKKTISRAILDRLSPEGIALWYMGRRMRSAKLQQPWRSELSRDATFDVLLEAEAELGLPMVKEMYSIAFKPFRDGRGWSIRTNTEGSRLFSLLVQQYVLQAMPEKLGHVADLNSRQRFQSGSAAVHNVAVSYLRGRRRGLCDCCYARRYYSEVGAGKACFRPSAGRSAQEFTGCAVRSGVSFCDLRASEHNSRSVRGVMTQRRAFKIRPLNAEPKPLHHRTVSPSQSRMVYAAAASALSTPRDTRAWRLFLNSARAV